jgi:hypothetical protein
VSDVSAGYCVIWFVLSLHFILVLVVVFVLGILGLGRNSTAVHQNKESDTENA